MQQDVRTVDAYLEGLPPDRRETLETVRTTILRNLPTGYAEGMQYGAIGYFVPHDVYPAGYHCDPSQPLPFAGLASRKNYMSLYLMCIYGNEDHKDWFRRTWKETGKKLDMGKSCVRFRRIEDVPLDVIGEAIRRVPVSDFIKHYEAALSTSGRH